ncbi:MAG: cupredoxin domain-containing protein [Candidatus Kerfeldbacteria bacterium]|nr:cupredoxin domain-containing protein [Candidatus Kerfeldbacteria bacterium]
MIHQRMIHAYQGFVLMLLVLFLLFALPSTAHAATQTFSMTAKQWSFSPSSITVNEGDTVTLNITSKDVEHGFYIDEFNVNATLSAGKTTTVTFVASKAGTYSFFCSVYCGEGHPDMSGTLVVKATDAEDEEEPAGDTTAPTISSVSVGSINSGSATVTWTTNEAGKGQVEYGTSSGSYVAATPLESSATTSHTASLSGLAADTTYYYRVKTTDDAGNLARSSESSFSTAVMEDDNENTNDDENDNTNEDDNENVNSNENDNTNDDEDANANDNTNDDENENTNDDNENINSDTASTVVIASLAGEESSFSASDSDITFSSTEEITISGTAEAGGEVIAEFCCAATRYSAIADSTGHWTISGKPGLAAGDQYVRIYPKGDERSGKKISLKITDGSDAANANNVTADKKDVSSINWAVVIIIAGLLIVLGSGVMFVRQMRR